MIISRTPFRVSFFGGGTDYPSWYLEHGGAVLATTIDKYCYLTCRYLPPFFEHRISVVYSYVERCKTIEDIQHPAVREVFRFLNVDRGISMHHDGDLPARSGMGSSSSFTVGLLHAMYALKGQMPSKRQLATESIHIEQERLKETVGSQDQVMAAYGGFNHVTFGRDGDISVRPMTLARERIAELNSHLMLIYTGVLRTASDIAESYVQNIKAKETQLQAMADMVDEGISILNSRQDITRFGELLHEGWQAKRQMGSRVSNDHVDDIYMQARSAGAVGGKLLGAGGGGFMLLFAPPERQEGIKDRLNTLVHVPFNLESSGTQIVFCDPGEDYSAEEQARANQPIQTFRELAYVADGEAPAEDLS